MSVVMATDDSLTVTRWSAPACEARARESLLETEAGVVAAGLDGFAVALGLQVVP